jgi:hypothetical protein
VLRDIFGPEPSGAYLTTKGFEHDFGTYYEVICAFNPEVPASINYAFRLEDEAPTTWPDDPGYNGSTPLCPECAGELEMGTGVQLFSFIRGDTYRCHSCKLLLAHDLTVLARMEG